MADTITVDGVEYIKMSKYAELQALANSRAKQLKELQDELCQPTTAAEDRPLQGERPSGFDPSDIFQLAELLNSFRKASQPFFTELSNLLKKER